jgi:hypothetical protein
MDEIFQKIKKEEQENFRIKALKLYGIEIPEGDTGKKLLQKAYIKFSTVSSIIEKNERQKDDKNFYRSHF